MHRLYTMSNNFFPGKGVFATHRNFLISISFQSDGVNLWYFKVRLSYLIEFIIWNI